MREENIKPLTSDNDAWHQAIKLFTGYDAPQRHTLFDKLVGNGGIPQMKVEVTKQSRVDYADPNDFNWRVENAGWRIENTDFVIPFYLTGGDNPSSGDQVSMYKARITLLGNQGDGPPAGGVVEGGEFKSQYDNHLGLTGDAAVWTTQPLTQYSYGTGRALEALLFDKDGTHGFHWNGKNVNNDQAVTLASFDTAAAAFDRVAQFFVDRRTEVEEWERRVGTEKNEAWLGQAAAVFWNLVHIIGKQYDGYAKDMRPAGVTGSKQGNELRQAKTDFRNAASTLQRSWARWEYMEGNPLRWLHDLLVEITDHVWERNIKMITYKVHANRYGSSVTYHTTSGFDQTATRFGKSDNFGQLDDLDTWKKVGERAIQLWQASVIESLEGPANEALRLVHNSWSTKNFDLGSVRTRGNADLTSTYNEDKAKKDANQAKKDADQAKKDAAELKAKQDAFLAWQKEQAAKAEAEAKRKELEAKAEQERRDREAAEKEAKAKAEQERKEKEAEAKQRELEAKQEAKEQEAKAEQERKEQEAKAEQERKEKEAGAKEAQAKAEQERKEAEAEAKAGQKEAEAERKQAEAEAKAEQKEAEQEQKQAEAEAKAEEKQREQEAKQEEAQRKQDEAQQRQEQLQIGQVNQARVDQERARKEQAQKEAEAEAKAEQKEKEAEAKQAEAEKEAEAKQAEAEAKAEQKEAEQERKQAEAEEKARQKEAEAEAEQAEKEKEVQAKQAEAEAKAEQRQQEQERKQAEAQEKAETVQRQREEEQGRLQTEQELRQEQLLTEQEKREAEQRAEAEARQAEAQARQQAAVEQAQAAHENARGDQLPGAERPGGERPGSVDLPGGQLNPGDLPSHMPGPTGGPVYADSGLTMPDGSATTIDDHGRIVTHHPDGSTVTIDPDLHTATVTRPDGTSVTGPLNTGDLLPRPDGSVSHIGGDGRVVTDYPDGTTTTIDPHTGIGITTRPDGTVISGDLNGDGTLPGGPGSHSSLPGPHRSPSPDGSLGSYEEELYDHTPYEPSFAGSSSGSGPVYGAPGDMGTQLNTGSLPGAGSGAGSASGAGGAPGPMGSPMGGMGGPMGGMGGGGGAGGSGTSERVRNVIDDGRTNGGQRGGRPRPGGPRGGQEENDVRVSAPRTATTGATPFTPMGGGAAPGGQQTQSGDRTRDAWVHEEEDVWGTDEGGAPAVIGR
ncbi:AAWKG family protein [Streptomyces subrutilus]|uniref:Microtubule/TRAF3 and DISC1 binding protein n=1 Tax=Streptomyces subrutilus TaxID=36818 RepID=A0A5P2UVZ1_9ACTN|nr:AAWKG family protein [Streptomyces subrutilus]QEU82405.1 microtubule/TRAF3 and DISC1 binding protein [Streptomyces subrutilus]WSJ28129.1 AAWKG family protein [Streptomyces subrutilus]GGZ70689.1 hypothetical protein GCM10010371_33340 [Streptomyces subrutilus]